jgi:hypothetical protein
MCIHRKSIETSKESTAKLSNELKSLSKSKGSNAQPGGIHQYGDSKPSKVKITKTPGKTISLKLALVDT